jgi:hypothetical protein
MDQSEEEQLSTLKLFRLFYNLIYSNVTKTQEEAYQAFNQMISTPENPLKKSPLLQSLMLRSRSRGRNTYFHLIANARDEQLLKNLRECFQSQTEAFSKIVSWQNLAGLHCLRIAFHAENHAFADLIHSLLGVDIFLESVHGCLKYHDDKTANAIIEYLQVKLPALKNEKWLKFFKTRMMDLNLFRYEYRFQEILAKCPAPSKQFIRRIHDRITHPNNRHQERHHINEWVEAIANEPSFYEVAAEVVTSEGSLLHYVVNWNHLDALRTIINRFKNTDQIKSLLFIEVTDKRTALHHAAICKNYEAFHLLKDACPDKTTQMVYLHQEDKLGKCAVDFLLDDIPDDQSKELMDLFYTPDCIGCTQLHYTVAKGLYHALVRLLYFFKDKKNIYKLLSQQAIDGDTVLHIAVKSKDNSHDLVDKLINDCPVNQRKNFLNIKNNLGLTAHDIAKNPGKDKVQVAQRFSDEYAKLEPKPPIIFARKFGM